MGLLDSDDDAIKKNMNYKAVLTARASLEKAVQSFKDKGGGASLIQLVATPILSIEKESNVVKKAHPDFKGCDEHLAFAQDVARAMCEKHPADPWTAKIKHLGAPTEGGEARSKGLLDSDDNAIKNTSMFKAVLTARAALEREVKFFKEKGGAASLVQRVATPVMSVEKESNVVKKAHPQFKGCDEHLAFAQEVAKAMCAKHPDDPWTAKIKHLAQ